MQHAIIDGQIHNLHIHEKIKDMQQHESTTWWINSQKLGPIKSTNPTFNKRKYQQCTTFVFLIMLLKLPSNVNINLTL
jgi:hypothetical protein